MCKITLSLLLASSALITSAALAQAPSTDLFVISIDGDSVGTPRHLTNREGYDNQPQFLPDGENLVYSSLGPDGTDIQILNLASGVSRTLRATPESEYSPTPIPGRPAVSVVRDFGNLQQELWSFPLDGGEPERLLPGSSPIGYHAWVDDSSVILFVLGEPHTLHRAHLDEEPGPVLAPSPGRILAHMPGSHEMTFVDKSGDDWWLTAIDLATGATRQIIQMPAGREDYAWATDGAAWAGDDSRLFRWHPDETTETEATWEEVADLDQHGVYSITRLVFSPDGSRLVLVGQRPPVDLTAAYQEAAGKILGAALVDTEGWDKIDHLATVIGHRLSGSTGLEEAIQWAADRMESEGFAVRKQAVMVPHWVRGDESATLVEPLQRPLAMLGLGNSVGTPAEGITAPVVVVRDFEELDALGREGVEGKIVVYSVEWRGYGYTVSFRRDGASRAAALGAVAILTRSATGLSLATPHTGVLKYAENVPRIPAAAITAEDADWLRRMAERDEEMVITLNMEAEMLPDAESFNVIAEIPGSERPEEVVVMGGHYDSWDVGEGVHDDGAACMAAWQALRVIQQLGLQPRRTLRVVLWTNEENGTRGGEGYRAALTDEQARDHVAAIEMDGGAERPVGFGFGMLGVELSADQEDPIYEAALVKVTQIGQLLAAIDAAGMRRGGGGTDIEPLMLAGVPGLGLRTVGEHYFDWHHTKADTLDKLDPDNFRRAIAMLGVMGYVLADMPERLVPLHELRPVDAPE